MSKTEKISRADLVRRLATEVMGWHVLLDSDCRNEADRIYKLDNSGVRFTLTEKGGDLLFVSRPLYFSGAVKWEPGTDSQQAEDLIEAWLVQDPERRGYALHRSLTPDTRYGLGFCLALRHSAYGWHPDVVAPTKPEAITRAVLAAIRADDKPRW